ncbi:uncharacterized protein UTRI_01252 [Ustilago trichophora]|uniref:Secreted protein n=1 Tax=Ustilago trichophora TaxID=86804 RepID=A0A5C3DVT6_9BASI|nr:uncharacterized protein UTRI_01252 [Ustilago trichophora]
MACSDSLSLLTAAAAAIAALCSSESAFDASGANFVHFTSLRLTRPCSPQKVIVESTFPHPSEKEKKRKRGRESTPIMGNPTVFRGSSFSFLLALHRTLCCDDAHTL